MVKPEYGKPIDRTTLEATLRFFDVLMRMLHPFMPFITEELWHHIYERKQGESIMRATLKIDAPTEADLSLLKEFEIVKQVVTGVRAVRNEKNIAQKQALTLQAIGENHIAPYNEVVSKMAHLKAIEVVAEKAADASAFLVGTNGYAVPLGDLIDVKDEIEKQEKELQHLEGFLAGIKKKLANENFVSHAPEAVVARERKKQSDSEEKIEALKASIAALKAK